MPATTSAASEWVPRNAIRNRLNAVYMTTFFLGGALGSSLTSPVLERFGWQGVAALGGFFPALALLYFLTAERRG